MGIVVFNQASHLYAHGKKLIPAFAPANAQEEPNSKALAQVGLYISLKHSRIV